jgi:hypothetical protein
MTMSTIIFLRKAARAGLLGIMAAGLTACSTVDQVLDVNNPEELDEGLLDDAALVSVLVSGVVGDFQNMYSDPFVWRGSMFTDIQITGVNWEQTARLSQRIVQYDEGDADLMFSDLSQARAQADSIAGRMKGGLSESPSNDPELAMVLAYAGYSYITLADAMCEATINVGSTIHQPVELYNTAVERFTEALAIANAAGGSTTLSNDRKVSDLIALINVGLSRANLNAGNNSAAMSAAANVPEGFYWWVEYNDSDDRTYNVLETRISGANHTIGVHPNFIAGGPSNWLVQDLEAELTDPRVQHEPRWVTGHNALSPLYKPKSGLMFSNYNGEMFATGGTPAVYERGTDIAMASYIEAMQNYYEAAGPNGTGPLGTTLEFVNARRAFGNQDPVNLSGNDLMAELRWQRGKDLFLGGYRLGDLRRWLRQGMDLFPSGPHPTAQWGSYGDATCYPLPIEEYEGNPNISR